MSIAAVSGCAEEATPQGGGGSTPSTGGAGATNSDGGANFGGGSNEGGGATCMATSKKAEPTPLDIIFMIDWTKSMDYGPVWTEIKAGLQTFFSDPLSAGISAGMVFMPTVKPLTSEGTCDQDLYKVLDIPIAPLPDNAFLLSNAMPADATGAPTPLWAGLSGALMAATAYQDAHPTHKVIVVMTGDGDYNTCSTSGIDPQVYNINAIAGWAQAALEYNGVRTYVMAMQGIPIECDGSTQGCFDRLQQIAEAGGTETYYDASNIEDFSAKMVEIRKAVLGCDFEIPEPPEGEFIVPDEVNFTYTPGGTGTPITLPRADNLADCGNEPGWYFDNNTNPSKIIVCPASCNTIQNDSLAAVAAEFGCASIAN
ncbi:MAG: hypothetical protein JNK04_07845 [Myxococcales bacterium]|nr:hypothetical protein [Myxococcales bacterium]